MVTTLGSIRVVVQTSRQEGRCRQTNRGRKEADADRRTGENRDADTVKGRSFRPADADIRTGGNAGKEKQNWKHVKWNSKLALIF